MFRCRRHILYCFVLGQPFRFARFLCPRNLHDQYFIVGDLSCCANAQCIAIDIRLEGIGNRARAPYISIERSGDTPGSC